MRQNSKLQKLAVVVLYSLMALALFKLKDIIMAPNVADLRILLYSLILGAVIAFTNNFKISNNAIKRSA